MAKITITIAERLLLGIITSVESGITTPSEGMKELEDLRKDVKKSGLSLEANYSLKDFQDIRQRYQNTYEVEYGYESYV